MSAGMTLIGVSLVLILRSPFRMPLGERLFRLVWLGPIGRVFVRFASRGVKQAESGRVAGTRATHVPTRMPATKPAAIPPSALPQLAALESRVAESERWRESVHG